MSIERNCDDRQRVQSAVSALRVEFLGGGVEAANAAVKPRAWDAAGALGHPISAAVASLGNSARKEALLAIVAELTQQACECDAFAAPRLGDFDENAPRTFGDGVARMLAGLVVEAAIESGEHEVAFTYRVADVEATVFVETLMRFAYRQGLRAAPALDFTHAPWRKRGARNGYHAVRHECQVMGVRTAIEASLHQLQVEETPEVRDALVLQLHRLSRADGTPWNSAPPLAPSARVPVLCEISYELALGASLSGDQRSALEHVTAGLAHLRAIDIGESWFRLRTKLLNCLALIRYRMGEFSEAIATEASVLEVDGIEERYRDVWELAVVSSAMNSARIMERAGDPDRAYRCLQRAVGVVGRAQNLLVELGRLSYDAARYADAEVWFSRALSGSVATKFAVPFENEILVRIQHLLCATKLGTREESLGEGARKLLRYSELLPPTSAERIQLICQSVCRS